MIQSVPLQMLSLVVIGFYCLMIYHFRGQIVVCLRNIASLSPEDKSGADNKQMYNNFLGVAMLLSWFVSGLAVVKVAATYFDGVKTLAADAPMWLTGIAPLVVGLVAAVISLLKFGILKTAGELTLSGEFSDTLTRIKRTHIAATAILFTPTVMVFSGVNPTRDWVSAAIAAVVLFALAISLAVQSIILFKKQKVSILVWFLYLCTVEIFPVSFVLLLAIKNS